MNRKTKTRLEENMNWFRSIELEQEILNRLRSKYIQDRSGELHVSDTIYCLTKAYWDKTQPLPATDQDLLYFASGLALEEVLLRDENVSRVEPRVVNGMVCSPDYQIQAFNGEMDLKTTRMTPGEDGSPKRGWPDSWLKQFMSYAYGMYTDQHLPEVVDYSVGILYLAKVPPILVAGTLQFTSEEIVSNMADRVGNQIILQEHLAKGEPPEPFAYTDDWQCKGCKYLLRCQNYV